MSGIYGRLESCFSEYTGDRAGHIRSSRIFLTLYRSKEGWVHIWDIDPAPIGPNTVPHRPVNTIRVGDRNAPEDGQEVVCMEWSRDGNLLAIGTSDPSVRIWSRLSGTLMFNLMEHKGTITSVRFSSNGKLLLSASLDGSIFLWDVERHKLKQKFESGHSMIILLKDLSHMLIPSSR